VGKARVGAIGFNDTHHHEWRRSVFDDDRSGFFASFTA
jgi:hypothetical protein